MYCHAPLQGPDVHGLSDHPTSELHEYITSLLFIIRNRNVRLWVLLQWHNIHINLSENRSTGS
jgi:hypothetical protein